MFIATENCTSSFNLVDKKCFNSFLIKKSCHAVKIVFGQSKIHVRL